MSAWRRTFDDGPVRFLNLLQGRALMRCASSIPQTSKTIALCAAGHVQQHNMAPALPSPKVCILLSRQRPCRAERQQALGGVKTTIGVRVCALERMMGHILESQQNECHHLRGEIDTLRGGSGTIRCVSKALARATNANIDAVRSEIDDMQIVEDNSDDHGGELEESLHAVVQLLIQKHGCYQHWILSQSGIVRGLQGELLEVRGFIGPLRQRYLYDQQLRVGLDKVRCLGGADRPASRRTKGFRWVQHDASSISQDPRSRQ